MTQFVASLGRMPQRTSYIPMVKGIGEDKFVGNGLRFATAEEALAYAADLQGRWMGCKAGAANRMAGESTDPVTHVWANHRVATIEVMPVATGWPL